MSRIVIKQRGARGFSAAEQAFAAGLLDAPTVAAFAAYLIDPVERAEAALERADQAIEDADAVNAAGATILAAVPAAETARTGAEAAAQTVRGYATAQSDIVRFGPTAALATGSGMPRRFRFVGEPLAQDCTLRTIQVFAASPGSIRIARFRKPGDSDGAPLKVGDELEQVGDPMFVEVTATEAAQTIAVTMACLAGEYIGYRATENMLVTAVGAPLNGGTWSQASNTTETGPFTLDTAASTEPQVVFEFDYLVVSKSRLAAIDTTLAQQFPVATAWERPVVPAGKTARIRDVTVQRVLDWVDGAWCDTGASPRVFYGTAPRILDATPTPIYAFSMMRKLKASYAGPLYRLRRTTDNRTLEVRTLAEALAFAAGGACKVVGIYNQATDFFQTFSPELDFALVDGLPSALNATAGAVNLFNSGTDVARDLWRNIPGIAGFYAARLPEFWAPAANRAMLRVESAVANTPRLAAELTSSGAISVQGRRVDASTNTSVTPGGQIGGNVEVIGWNVDAANNRLRSMRYLRTVRDRALDTAGAGLMSDTRPLAAVTSVVAEGVNFFEMVAWNSGLTDVQHAALLADMQAAWSNWRPDRVLDGATSWWNDVAVTLPDGSVIAGFSNRAGQHCLAEFTAARALVGVRELGEPLFGFDDHVQASLRVLDDGTLVAALTGHSNALAGTPAGTNGRVDIWTSESGHIADLVGPITPASTATALNYGQWFESASNLALATNDDAAVTWFPFFSIGKDVGALRQGKPIMRQTVAPGGGQNQLYQRGARLADDVARMVFTAHPSNVGNALRLVEYDPKTGNVWTSQARAVIGNVHVEGDPTSLLTMPAAPAIYTAPAGKSVRLFDVGLDGAGILIALFDNPGGVTAKHILLLLSPGADPFLAASWTSIDLPGETGVPFQGATSWYWHAAAFGEEPRGRGIRIYRNRNELIGGVRTWHLERLDSRNGGLTWKARILRSSTQPMVRCFPVKQARIGAAVVQMEGPYTSFTSWRQRMLLLPSGD